VRRGHRLEHEWMASDRRGWWDGTGTEPNDDTVELEAAQGERMPITRRQEARSGDVKRKKAGGTLPISRGPFLPVPKVYSFSHKKNIHPNTKKIVLLQVKQHELSIIFPDKKRKVKKLAGDRESKSVPARKAPGNPPTKGNQNESDFTHADAPKPNHESRVSITYTGTLSAGHAVTRVHVPPYVVPAELSTPTPGCHASFSLAHE
jgi:hypothetical protein